MGLSISQCLLSEGVYCTAAAGDYTTVRTASDGPNVALAVVRSRRAYFRGEVVWSSEDGRRPGSLRAEAARQSKVTELCYATVRSCHTFFKS